MTRGSSFEWKIVRQRSSYFQNILSLMAILRMAVLRATEMGWTVTGISSCSP